LANPEQYIVVSDSFARESSVRKSHPNRYYFPRVAADDFSAVYVATWAQLAFSS